jgi:glycosyltransferase involved in cell wall biosynthesis
LIDSLEVGGGERMAVNIANLLSLKDIPNLLVVSRKSGPLEIFLTKKNSLKLLSKKNSFDLIAFWDLVGIIRDFKPTIIHAHDTSVFWAGLIRVFFPKIKLVWHAHYGGLVGGDNRFGKQMPLVKNKINGFIGVNSELVSWAKSQFPNCDQFEYISNFADIPSGIKKNGSKKIISCIANLKHPKNHKLLVRSFFHFQKRHREYQLNLVGKKSDENYFDDLKSEIESLGIQSSVHFLGEVLDLSEVFEQTTFAVLASEVEGLPVSLLELGLAGIPIISSGVGQCPQLLGHGKFGYLFQSGSEKELVDKMCVVAENLDIAETKARDFKKEVESNYGKEGFWENYTNFLNLLN